MAKCPNCEYYLPSEKTFFLSPYIGLSCPSCKKKLVMTKESIKRASNRVIIEIIILMIPLLIVTIALTFTVGIPSQISLFVFSLILLLFGFWSYLRNLNNYGIIITIEEVSK